MRERFIRLLILLSVPIGQFKDTIHQVRITFLLHTKIYQYEGENIAILGL